MTMVTNSFVGSEGSVRGWAYQLVKNFMQN